MPLSDEENKLMSMGSNVMCRQAHQTKEVGVAFPQRNHSPITLNLFSLLP